MPTGLSQAGFLRVIGDCRLWCLRRPASVLRSNREPCASFLRELLL